MLVASIQHAMASKKLIIADGHHRYETALAFRNEHPELQDAQRVMMTFVNMEFAGAARSWPRTAWWTRRTSRSLLSQARAVFPGPAVESLDALRRRGPNRTRAESGSAGDAAGRTCICSRPDREPGQLDVPFLHDRILRDMLRIGEDAVRNEKRIRYMRGADAAFEEVRRAARGSPSCSKPTAVEDVAGWRSRAA